MVEYKGDGESLVTRNLYPFCCSKVEFVLGDNNTEQRGALLS